MEVLGARLVCLFTFLLLLTATGAAQSLSEMVALMVALAVIIVLAAGAELDHYRRQRRGHSDR